MCLWVHRHVKWSTDVIWVVGIRAQRPGPCDQGRNGRNRRDSLGLSDSFVVSKEKCPILEDRSTDSSPKLVALEGWGGKSGIIEKVPGVQFVIPEKFVRAPMKLICPRARNRVDHAAGRLAVLGRVVAGQHRKLLNGVDAQAPS